MTLLTAALFPDVHDHHPVAAAAARPRFGSVRAFYIACVQPALHLSSFRRQDLTDETV